jgi:hypothetical protein
MSDEQTAEKPKRNFTKRGGHGGPVGNQKGFKHGFYSLNLGGALDKRTALETDSGNSEAARSDLGGDLFTAQRMLLEDMVVDTRLIHGLNARLGVAAIYKGKVNPIYTLHSQLISIAPDQRRFPSDACKYNALKQSRSCSTLCLMRRC